MHCTCHVIDTVITVFSFYAKKKHKEVLFISTLDIKPTLKSTIWYVEMISSYLTEKKTLYLAGSRFEFYSEMQNISDLSFCILRENEF